MDVGIVAEYSEHDHDIIVRILAAFIRRQGRLAGRLMIDDSNRRLEEANMNDAALEEENKKLHSAIVKLQSQYKDQAYQNRKTIEELKKTNEILRQKNLQLVDMVEKLG